MNLNKERLRLNKGTSLGCFQPSDNLPDAHDIFDPPVQKRAAVLMIARGVVQPVQGRGGQNTGQQATLGVTVIIRGRIAGLVPDNIRRLPHELRPFPFAQRAHPVGDGKALRLLVRRKRFQPRPHGLRDLVADTQGRLPRGEPVQHPTIGQRGKMDQRILHAGRKNRNHHGTRIARLFRRSLQHRRRPAVKRNIRQGGFQNGVFNSDIVLPHSRTIRRKYWTFQRQTPILAAMADKKTEQASLGRQIMRYGRVGGTMAGLAARMAGERYFGIKIERGDHARQLTEALGNLKGPLMKVGQILATIPEALPAEYAHDFQQLQSNAPPMGWPFVKRRMKSELDADWEAKFKSFDKEAAAAASLGQVHRATAHDGTQLACKLQYPDMASAIAADLNQLKIIFSIYERYDSSIRTKYIHEELSARLYEELDYALEARHCKLYAQILKDEQGVHVPAVIDDLSTDRLLTATWLDGRKILDFVDAHPEERNALAMNMFRAWYVPLYYYGIIHGDPHLGNYTVRKDHSINLLDFGCIRVFQPKFVGGVIDLYHSLMENDLARSVHAYETWGFTNLSKEQIETLNIWARFLYAPLMEDRVRPIGEVTNGVFGRETAQKVHERLRAASKDRGGVSIPREFVFMDRAALGLGSVFLHLKAEINWYRVFNELIADFGLGSLEKRQKEILKQFNIPQGT